MYEQLFDAIESDRFSATLNVVSGLKQFERVLSSTVEVQELLAGMQTDTGTGVVVRRLDEVFAREIDPTYENPWDVAMAAYLHVIEQVDPKQAAVCAEQASSCSNGWWSTKIADQILSSHQGNLHEQVLGRPPVSTGA